MDPLYGAMAPCEIENEVCTDEGEAERAVGRLRGPERKRKERHFATMNRKVEMHSAVHSDGEEPRDGTRMPARSSY